MFDQAAGERLFCHQAEAQVDFSLIFAPSLGYDEPEILSSAIDQIGLMGADRPTLAACRELADSILAGFDLAHEIHATEGSALRRVGPPHVHGR